MQVGQVAGVRERLTVLEESVEAEVLRRVPDQWDLYGARAVVQRVVRVKGQAGRRVDQLVKLDDVVACRCLTRDFRSHLVRAPEPRLVDERPRGVQGRTQQQSVRDPAAPFKLRRRSTEIEHRRHAVREIQRRLTEIVPRRRPWHAHVDMHVPVGKSWQEKTTASIDHSGIRRHHCCRRGPDRNNAISVHEDCLVEVDTLAIHRDYCYVYERDDRSDTNEQHARRQNTHRGTERQSVIKNAAAFSRDSARRFRAV